METKAKGIILKLTDYKDADKLASIFTFDLGKITAKFVGVKKDKAKMKAVAQPFSFAEFIFNENGKNKTIISADLIDSFSGLQTNYNKMICAYIVLDIIEKIIPLEKPENEILILTINALKNIEEKSEYISLIDFILKFISFEGMEIETPNKDYVYLDTYSGNFIESRIPTSTEIDKKVYFTIKTIKEQDEIETIEEKLTQNQISENTLKQAIRLLHNVLYSKFNEDIKSFEFI